MINSLFEFITFAFPKAGIQVGVPLTVAMVVFLLAVYRCQYRIVPAFMRVSGLSWFYLLFVLAVCLAFIFNLGGLSSSQVTMAMVVVASPLAIGIGSAVKPQVAMKILALAMIIVGGYALIQYLFGILNTSIPGLTYTFGQDLAEKPIGYGMAESGGEALKMPSTYQNGNGAGLFYALGLPILLAWFPKTFHQIMLKYSAVIIGLVGLFLSGSRSIMVPFVLLFIFLIVFFKNKLSYRQQLFYVSMLLFSTVIIGNYLVQSQSQFLADAYHRYIAQTLTDPTGAQRVPQLQAAFNAVNSLNWQDFLRFVLIGYPWQSMGAIEGLLSTLFAYGLCGFISFVGMLITAIIAVYRRNKLAAIGFICAFVAFIVDGSFNFPPALMNFFLLTGLVTQPADLKAKQEKPARSTEHSSGRSMQWISQ